MRKPDLKLTALLAAMLATVYVHAQDSGTFDSSAYRLDPDKNAQFRLNINGNEEPDNSALVKSEISPQLVHQPYAALIHKAARDAALDPAFVHAVIHVESHYNPAARSPKGAIGLMQLLPATAARYGVRDPGISPEANIRAGTRYLRDLMRQFEGRLDLVLAAYNAGENAVVRHGFRIPPYQETKLYVPKVMSKYHEWGTPKPSEGIQQHIQYLEGTRLEN